MHYVQSERLTVVVRELHVLYKTEGWMHETFVGGVRVHSRRGKAGIVEERLVEGTTGRSVARAWAVQLLVSQAVVEWPAWYLGNGWQRRGPTDSDLGRSDARSQGASRRLKWPSTSLVSRLGSEQRHTP